MRGLIDTVVLSLTPFLMCREYIKIEHPCVEDNPDTEFSKATLRSNITYQENNKQLSACRKHSPSWRSDSTARASQHAQPSLAASLGPLRLTLCSSPPRLTAFDAPGPLVLFNDVSGIAFAIAVKTSATL